MAKRGWQPISANFLMPEWVKTHWASYSEGREAVGAKASPSEWRVAKSIFVADDEATARRYALESSGPYHFYFKQLIRKLVVVVAQQLVQNRPRNARQRGHPGLRSGRLALAGTVNSVVDQILAFRENIGDFGQLSMHAMTGWTPRWANARWSCLRLRSCRA
jgi:alkanesulfonate monooxygenase SsuD/methylene tetrahydromethanopterin reductase-like flavin-dependent oxidoreductase (luciferase family)